MIGDTIQWSSRRKDKKYRGFIVHELPPQFETDSKRVLSMGSFFSIKEPFTQIVPYLIEEDTSMCRMVLVETTPKIF